MGRATQASLQVPAHDKSVSNQAGRSGGPAAQRRRAGRGVFGEACGDDVLEGLKKGDSGAACGSRVAARLFCGAVEREHLGGCNIQRFKLKPLWRLHAKP